MKKYGIENRIWKVIFKYFKEVKYLHTNNEYMFRRFFEAVWYVARGGISWRLLPRYYGNWNSVYKKFTNWCKKGIWERLLNYFLDPDLEYVMIDSTVVRAHSCAAGSSKQLLGRSAGGFTSKIHALVDALGNPLKFILTAGQRSDISQAQALIAGIANSQILADKAYDANQFLNFLKLNNNIAVIPPKKNRKIYREYDQELYKERHKIEILFNKIKQYRRISSRYDKNHNAYLGFIYFVAVLIWLK